MAMRRDIECFRPPQSPNELLPWKAPPNAPDSQLVFRPAALQCLLPDYYPPLMQSTLRKIPNQVGHIFVSSKALKISHSPTHRHSLWVGAQLSMVHSSTMQTPSSTLVI